MKNIEQQQKELEERKTGDFVGLFVRGDSESRDGSLKVANVLILKGHPHRRNPLIEADLLHEALMLETRKVKARVCYMKSGDVVFQREVPEDTIRRLPVY